MTPLFRDSREHLLEELRWVELVLQNEVARAGSKRNPEEKFDEFSGLFIPEQEIARYMADDRAEAEVGQPDSHQAESRLQQRIADKRTQLDLRIQATLDAGVGLRIVDLVRTFRLTSADVFVLLSVMAPDIDVRFERYFGFLQNDVSKRRPTLQLLNRIWGNGQADRVSVREAFAPGTALLSEQLLLLPREGDAQPFAVQQPVAAANVTDYIAGVDRLDTRLRGIATLLDNPACRQDTSFKTTLREISSSAMIALIDDAGRAQVPYVFGPPGSGKSDIVSLIANNLSQRVLQVRCGNWLAAQDSVQVLDLLKRDARLLGCMLHFSDIDVLLGQEQSRPSLVSFRSFLQLNASLGIVLTGVSKYPEVRTALGMSILGFEIPYPTLEERMQIWREKLGTDHDWIPRLAVSFRFTAGQIDSVVESASRNAGRDNADELFRCCRDQSSQTLLNFATKIVPRYRWTDLVLPTDTQAQLEEISNCVRSKATVFGAWGFDQKFSLGKGLNVLFSGASGTGKTMSAEVIAGDLQLDLFKVDLSCIVSKYVGETERNLSKIFHEATTSNAILFFDEADALFGKRSEVKDSHDRYANIEINYLLQKMDDYEGIVILATNLRSNLDSAFTRRLNHVVEFPFPDESYREMIWLRVFPQQTPLSDDIDFDFLAKRFKLTGGNIRNIALNGAFLAARNGGQVTMEHIIQATRREFQKMGKLCSKSEFGCYYRLLREEVAV